MTVTILPEHIVLEGRAGQTLASLLQQAGLSPDAPCGGKGTCGKCRLLLDGTEVLACQTVLTGDCTVTLPRRSRQRVLTEGLAAAVQPDGADRYALAFDLGTTTLVCHLLDGVTGKVLATASSVNPQTAFGGDVISRIQTAQNGQGDLVTGCVRQALAELTQEAAKQAAVDPKTITMAVLVGNTAMHHLYLGIDPSPLVHPPYMPGVRQSLVLPAGEYLPICEAAVLRVLPNIAGFVGADTVGCLAACRFDRLEELTLLLDIGTNGELVLGDKRRSIACSTAAGPAFEGAKIEFGMRGAEGAIDHVTVENGQLRCHVIGDGPARGICGSGLLDAAYALLQLGALDETGRLQLEDFPHLQAEYRGRPAVRLAEHVFLTQKDIRELQLAKGAIRAGVELLLRELRAEAADIRQVYLAGAFGNYLDPRSACGIGLIPPCLEGRIVSIGNAAGAGAQLCALSEAEFLYAQKLADGTEFLELASRPDFQDCYVDCLGFGEDAE